jgi:hypothetical protein
VLFAERGEGTRGAPTVYLRGTDGGPAVKLGEGRPLGLSTDGEWAITTTADRQKLMLLATGAGAPRELPAGPITRFIRATWFPRTNRLLVLGSEADRSRRCYVMNVSGGAPQRIGPEGPSVDFSGNPISPDESVFAALGSDGDIALYPLNGGAPRPLKDMPPGVMPIQWAPDGKHLYLSQRESFPARIFRADVGKRAEPWKELLPADATGIVRIPSIEMSADGKAYVYTFNHRLSELYLADGLK